MRMKLQVCLVKGESLCHFNGEKQTREGKITCHGRVEDVHFISRILTVR